MDAIRLSGETYPLRRELVRLGGRYDRARNGYVFPPSTQDAVAAFVAQHLSRYALQQERIDVPYDPSQPLTQDERLAQRNAARLRRADQLDRQAAQLESQAQEHLRKVTPYDDYAFWTQPILTDHHSARGMIRLRERLSNHRSQASDQRKHAESLHATAKRLRRLAQPASVDPPQVRDPSFQVGSIVHVSLFGSEGTIVKVNPHSYSVRLESGYTMKLSQENMTFLRHSHPERSVRRLAKGDSVVFRRLLQQGIGQVIRVNPNNYTVQFDIDGKMTTAKFMDADLAPHILHSQAESIMLTPSSSAMEQPTVGKTGASSPVPPTTDVPPMVPIRRRT